MRTLIALLFLVSVPSVFGEEAVLEDFVSFANLDDHNPSGMVSEYKLFDNATGKEIAYLTRNSFAKVFLVKGKRAITIRLKLKGMLPLPDFFGPYLSLVLDQKMAGRIQLIERTYDLDHMFTPFHLADGSEQDLDGLTEYSDKTLTRPPGNPPATPLIRVSLLLDRNPFYDPFEVKSLAKSLTVTERQGLYETYKTDPSNAFWNVVPGLGVGSYTERDYPFAVLFTVGELGSMGAGFVSGSALSLNIFALSSGGRSPYSPSENQTLAAVLAGAVAVYLCVKVGSVVRAATYPAEYNARLKDILDVDQQ